MLIRRYVNASFRLLAKAEWENEWVDKYNAVLTCTGAPISLDNGRVPPSLAYHLCDIYVEELNKVLFAAIEVTDQPHTPIPLARLLQPFVTLASRTPSNHTLERVRTAVFEPLLHSFASPTPTGLYSGDNLSGDAVYTILGCNACLWDPNAEGRIGQTALHLGLLKLVFDTACDPDSRDSNRRKLYAFWKENVLDDDDDGERVTIPVGEVDAR